MKSKFYRLYVMTRKLYAYISTSNAYPERVYKELEEIEKTVKEIKDWIKLYIQ